MKLFKTGYIVAIIENYHKFSYKPWPLSDVENDNVAESLVDEGDNKWFMMYDMLEISPDYNYVSRYNEYCKSIGINTCILMIESPYNYFDIQDNNIIASVYGYDCIGVIGYSYLDNDRDIFEEDFEKSGIGLTQYGLLDSLESVEKFVEMRGRYIIAGNNLENFWDMIPIRLSKVD